MTMLSHRPIPYRTEEQMSRIAMWCLFAALVTGLGLAWLSGGG